jgi:hypothetical protein
MVFQMNASGTFQECHWFAVHLTHLINHCIRLSHFPTSWKEAKVIALPKPIKDPKIPQNLRPIGLLPLTGNFLRKLFYKLSKNTLEEGTCLMQVSLTSVRVTAPLLYVRLADHVTLNFNNKISAAVVFLDNEKAYDTTWHSGLLYKLSKCQRQGVCKQGCHKFPSPTLYNLHIKDNHQTIGVNLALFADDTSLYAAERKEGYVLRKV